MLQEIIDVLAQYTDVPSEQINETSNLIDDLELNSFDVMTIVADFRMNRSWSSKLWLILKNIWRRTDEIIRTIYTAADRFSERNDRFTGKR